MSDMIKLANGSYVTPAQLNAAFLSGLRPTYVIDINWGYGDSAVNYFSSQSQELNLIISYAMPRPAA
jgi:hypothetical protein